MEYTCMKKDRYYMRFNQRQARLIFNYQIGEINVRANRPGESRRLKGGTKCLTPGCEERDEWEHLLVCEGYKEVRPYEGELNGQYERLGDVLDRIDKFRYRRYGEGLILRLTAAEKKKFEEKRIENPQSKDDSIREEEEDSTE